MSSNRLRSPLRYRLPLTLLSAGLLLGCAPTQSQIQAVSAQAPATQGSATQAPAAQALASQPPLPRGEVQLVPVRQSAEQFQHDLAPHTGQMEWWYLSSSLPESGLALHWALFKVELFGAPLYLSHVAVTDLKTDRINFTETLNQAGAGVRFPPLSVTQDGNTLTQVADGFTLKTPDLDLRLKPLKAAVRHPASGTPASGQLEYQSVTRMNLAGTVSGQTVDGLGWFDHQWGDQLPGQSAFWDWMGLQLSDGSDLMLYRVRDASGTVLQTYGTRVAPDGQPSTLNGLTMEPLRRWQSAQGREYPLDWKLGAADLNLNVTAPRNEQELVSRTTGVTYWEGPLLASGTVGGQAVTASGMGEFLSVPPPKTPER